MSGDNGTGEISNVLAEVRVQMLHDGGIAVVKAGEPLPDVLLAGVLEAAKLHLLGQGQRRTPGNIVVPQLRMGQPKV